MTNPVPIASPTIEEFQPKPEVEEKSGAEKAIEDIRRLGLEKQERLGAKLGQVGIVPAGGSPPMKAAKQQQDDSPQQQSASQQQTAADIFSQLSSVGYKPSNQALNDAASKAYNGSTTLSGTWLAHLFIRLLKASK